MAKGLQISNKLEKFYRFLQDSYKQMTDWEKVAESFHSGECVEDELGYIPGYDTAIYTRDERVEESVPGNEDI